MLNKIRIEIVSLNRNVFLYILPVHIPILFFIYSDELMAALGLERQDLPPWIPLMRACGYPPGHIRNCIVESSGLDLVTEGTMAELDVQNVNCRGD